MLQNWYDYLGRVTVAQNAEQKNGSRYSYTSFDEQNRIVEVGEASVFPHLFLSEDKSNSVEAYSMAVNVQTNTAIHGSLVEQAWYSHYYRPGARD